MRYTNYEAKQVQNYQIFILAPIFIALTILLFWAVGRGIDKSIENQDTMLCNSAKVSGNEEYLKKCECYYRSGEIKCLQGEVKGLTTDLVVEDINTERIKANLKVVKINPILVKTATLKACDMKNNNYFSHDDLQGKKSWHYFTENGYNGGTAGENLARGIRDDYVTDRWMASETHKAIILGSSYKEVGIGRCGNYTVAHFGSH